ncbi:MAG: hypothetical protein Q9175_001356 [Cornicularia normoerica]
MTMKSITSGNLVESKIKQRQNRDLETTPMEQNVLKPTSPQKHSALRERASEVRATEVHSSDQVIDLTIAPIADPLLTLKEQRRDIDRIMASVNILQQDMISLRQSVENLENRSDQASHDFAGDVDLLTDTITNVSSKLSELDALKLEMKMMQQRIKRMEDSKSMGRRSSTVLGSAHLSRRTSPTMNEQATPRNDAPSNGPPFSASQVPMSAYFDGLSAPQTASRRHDVMDGGDSSSKGLPLGSKAEALPPQKPFTPRPRASINGTASRGSHTPVNMPPPQIPPTGPEQNIMRRKSSTSSTVATTRTASPSITATANSTSLPRVLTQIEDASTGPHCDPHESHIYDDELVDDRPRSSTGSSTRNALQPASKAADSRQNRKKESAQQPPSQAQHRKSVPPPTPEPSNERKITRGRTTHHDSKRRKTTAFDANTPSTSIWAAESRESESSSGRRAEPGLLVRVNGEVDGRYEKFQNLKSKGRERPGERDTEGYLLKPDGTRNPVSVKCVDQWKKKKAKLSG